MQEYAVIDSSTFLDLYKRKEAKNLEPVYHELLIEAEKAIFNNSIRSGLLILYSAIEVATRRFVREVNEESDYINDRLDWVKLVELYKDYINKEIKIILSPEEIAKLQEMTRFRNAIAHHGNTSIKNDKKDITFTKTMMNEYLTFAKTIISRIDKELKYIM